MESFEIDFDRLGRLGFPEVIFGATKSVGVLVRLLESYRERGQNALITKLQEEKIEQLLQHFPDAVTFSLVFSLG